MAKWSSNKLRLRVEVCVAHNSKEHIPIMKVVLSLIASVGVHLHHHHHRCRHSHHHLFPVMACLGHLREASLPPAILKQAKRQAIHHKWHTHEPRSPLLLPASRHQAAIRAQLAIQPPQVR